MLTLRQSGRRLWVLGRTVVDYPISQWQQVLFVVAVVLVATVTIWRSGPTPPPPSTPAAAPAPVVIVRHTDDVLDVGPECLYTWEQGLYLWKKADMSIPESVECPSLEEARRVFGIGQRGPVKFTVAP